MYIKSLCLSIQKWDGDRCGMETFYFVLYHCVNYLDN